MPSVLFKIIYLNLEATSSSSASLLFTQLIYSTRLPLLQACCNSSEERADYVTDVWWDVKSTGVVTVKCRRFYEKSCDSSELKMNRSVYFEKCKALTIFSPVTSF